MSDGDWNDLQYFLAVARTGRLTSAGKRLRVNHSTVDRRIRALEQSLNANLFERTPTGYLLSQSGRNLLPFAEDMEARWLAAASEIGHADERVSGTLRIGAPDGFGSYFLASRLGHVTAAYPELKIELVAMPRILNPTKREADITIGFERPTHGRLISRKLTDYSLHLYASKDYIARHGAPLSVSEVCQHPLIGYIEELVFVEQLDYLDDVVTGLDPQLTSTNIIAQLQMCREGHGLCVLPYFMARQHDDLEIVLPQIRLTRSFYIIYGENLAHLTRIRHMTGAIGEWALASRSELLSAERVA